MSKLWSVIISVLVVLTLGMAQAPRPCIGDGHGGACSATSCQCVEGCTCHVEHWLEQQEAAKAAAAHVHDSCCGNACEMAHSRPSKAVSCHQHGHSSNFAPPQHRWLALFPETSSPLTFAPGHVASNWALKQPDKLPLPPPEKPPRFAA
jgi:hypothetical protein